MRVFSPCFVFGHADHPIRSRNDHGHLVLRCWRCDQVVRVVLPDQVLRVRAEVKPVWPAKDQAAVAERERRLAESEPVKLRRVR